MTTKKTIKYYYEADRYMLVETDDEAFVAKYQEFQREEWRADKRVKAMLQEQEAEISERAKKQAREITQKEKDILKLKEEVIKVIMGASNFSQELLSELIQTREAELLELKNKYDGTQAALADIGQAIISQKSVSAELESWGSRFDTLDTMSQKSMLLSIVEKITIHEEKADILYRINFDTLLSRPIPPVCPETDEEGANTPILTPQSSKQFVHYSSLATQSIACRQYEICGSVM